jgi:cytochrome c oxidase subunit 2
VVPMVILIFIAFPSLYLLYLIEDISNPSVTVKVIGHQWYWEYQYRNSWSTVSFDSYMVYEKNGVLHYRLDVDNRLVLPRAVPLLFLVSSQDVIHSWAVPCLGVKADAIPGRINSLSREINSSGVYYGQCSEICGANHRFMPIVLEVIPPAAFLNHLEKLS